MNAMKAMMIAMIMRVMTAFAAIVISQASAIAGTITYYHNDLTGSPVAATNGAGQVIWRESYRPYGERTTNSAASTVNDVWFTSRRQDAESGLVYMGARYYDPLTGRFASTDPRGFDESNLHSFNRYEYANNNPYKYVDPDGRAGVLVTTAAGAGAGSMVWPGPGTIIGGVAGLAIGVWGTWKLANLIFNDGANSDSSQPGTGGDTQGEKDPSTPTGRKGSPLDVKPGTNNPTTIGDRDYSGHALDRMQGHGVPPSAVEDAIANGSRSPGHGNGTTVHAGENGVTVVVGDRGQVVTVIPR